MTGDIHELSAVIGRLQEATESAQRDRKEILTKLDSLEAGLAIVPQMKAALDELRPDVERLKRERWIGLGLLVRQGGRSGGEVLAEPRQPGRVAATAHEMVGLGDHEGRGDELVLEGRVPSRRALVVAVAGIQQRVQDGGIERDQSSPNPVSVR